MGEREDVLKMLRKIKMWQERDPRAREDTKREALRQLLQRMEQVDPEVAALYRAITVGPQSESDQWFAEYIHAYSGVWP